MEVFKKGLILILCTFALGEKLNSEKYPTPQAHSPTQNKTIDKLIQEQTDLIKQIVSSSKGSTVNYPLLTKPTKVDKKDDAKLKKQKEEESIEELRNKCHELSKLGLNGETNNEQIKNNNKVSTVEAFGPPLKPQFLENPLKYPQTTESQTSEQLKDHDALNINEQNPKIISERKDEEKPSDFHRYLMHSNVQYVEFEPFVLQKIVLASGKELFYWYKKYPTVPQFISVAHQQLEQLNHQSENGDVSNQNSPTTPEVERVPNYDIEYSPNKNIDNNLYRKQMKFVIPMKYTPTIPKSEEPLTSNLDQFDPYAYYPKSHQPSTVQITVPYSPTYHMIKTLTLPNEMEEAEKN